MISQEANELAYRVGLRELAPLVQRLIDAEIQLQTLSARIEFLERQSVPVHLKSIEKRKA